MRLLPNRRATDLLAAMLLEGAPALEGWRRWTLGTRNAKRALGDDAMMARPLLAMLYDGVRRNALPVDEETATYLRSAFLTESLRSRAYREIVNELTDLLRAADVEFLLIRGAALGELYYADAALRHAHDIEILVDDAAVVRAALGASRFRAAAGGFVHASGLPLRVHERLCIPVQVTMSLASGVHTLDAAGALAQALVHASGSISRRSCRWVCDAHAIVRSGTVDWPLFSELVTAAGATSAVRRQLAWLRSALGVPVPSDVLAPVATPWWRLRS